MQIIKSARNKKRDDYSFNNYIAKLIVLSLEDIAFNSFQYNRSYILVTYFSIKGRAIFMTTRPRHSSDIYQKILCNPATPITH